MQYKFDKRTIRNILSQEVISPIIEKEENPSFLDSICDVEDELASGIDILFDNRSAKKDKKIA